MKKSFTSVIVALLIVAVAFSAAFSLPAGRSVISTGVKESSSSSQVSSKGYTVKLYNNRIGVFSDGSQEPEQLLDTEVQSLPKSEQDKLQAGIHVNNRNELLSLLENYSS